MKMGRENANIFRTTACVRIQIGGVKRAKKGQRRKKK